MADREHEERVNNIREMIVEIDRPVVRNAVLNDIAGILNRHFGFLPFNVRYGAAEMAVKHVESSNAEHRLNLTVRLEEMEAKQ